MPCCEMFSVFRTKICKGLNTVPINKMDTCPGNVGKLVSFNQKYNLTYKTGKTMSGNEIHLRDEFQNILLRVWNFETEHITTSEYISVLASKQ